MRPFVLLLCWLTGTQDLWAQKKPAGVDLVIRFRLSTNGQAPQPGAAPNFLPAHRFYIATGKAAHVPAIIFRRLNVESVIIALQDQEQWRELTEKGVKLFPANDLWKLSPDLLDKYDQVPRGQQEQYYLVSLQDLSKEIPGKGIDFTELERDPVSNTIRIQAKPSWSLEKMLSDPNITFIGAGRTAKTERELTGFDLTANSINTAHAYWPAITGSGLTISIKENRMDTADIDFKGRYVFSPGASAILQTHATTMATIAAGAGNSFYTGKGVAFGSRISSSDFANLLPDDAISLSNLQVSVQNHSYGTAIENYYGADARAYDLQVNANPTLVHVFSAGNSGLETSTSGNYAGIPAMANITGSFKMAKNVLVVGAMDSLGNIPALISRGPAFDGRIKPELVAFGEDGSSGAAAIASGIAALVQDGYKKVYGNLPAAALVKALMTCSANDVGAPGIDFFSGYGALDAYRCLDNLSRKHFSTGTIRAGETQTIQIELPLHAIHGKVVLHWTDPAALANSSTALVNDLDLNITTGNGETFLPWVLNSSPDLAALSASAVRKRDSLNNTELVTLEDGVSGPVFIHIKAPVQLLGSQDYAIAWQYDTLQSFRFNFPVKGGNIQPSVVNTIRWATTYSGTADLEYRQDDETDWKLAISQVDLAKGYARWLAPQLASTIQFRLSAPNLSAVSEFVSLSGNLQINTGYNCVDSLLLYWQNLPQAGKYRLYNLPGNYLEPYRDLADTSLVMYQAEKAGEWFAVAPLLHNNIEGQKSYAFDFTRQETGCYLKSFLADPVGPGEARLTLELGTIYGVKSVGFEKQSGVGFVSIGSVIPSSTLFTFPASAEDGLNQYRAKIELKNGRFIYSGVESVYQFDAQAFFVFPNPVPRGEDLQVLTKEPGDSWFVLFDLAGRRLISRELVNTRQGISLSQLQPGVYFCTLFKNGKRMITKKIILN